MNSFYKNNKQIFSLLLGVLLSSSLHALTFRNEPLGNTISRGDVLSATFARNSFVILEMENDNFDIGNGNINAIDNLEEAFQEVRDKDLRSMRSLKSLDFSANSIDYNWVDLAGLEHMNMQAKTSLKFTHCLFESPLIHFIGNTMNFKNCFFINPQILNIIVDYPGSDYKVIQIIFYDQPEYPTFIDGQIDLNNQTKQTLMFSNVKEINIEFNPQAWDN